MGTKPQLTLGWFRYVTIKDVVLLVCGISFLTLSAGLHWFVISGLGSFKTNLIYYNANDPLSMKRLLNSMWKMVIFTVVLFISSMIGMTATMFFCDRQIKAYQTSYLKVLMRKDIAYFNAHKPGSLVELLNGIDPVVSEKIGFFIYTFVLFWSAQIANFVNSWQMALSANLLTVFFIFSAITQKLATFKAVKRYNELTVRIENMVADVLTGILTVINCNGQKFEVERYEELVDKQIKERRYLKYSMAVCIGVNAAIIDLVFTACYWIALVMSFRNNIPIGTSTAYTDYILNVLCITWQITPYFAFFRANYGTAKHILEIINSPSTDHEEGLNRPSDVNGNIIFKDVHYEYPSRPETKVLKGVDLEIKAGQKVAFVGSSGSGKSTAAAMLVKLLNPTRGRIFLDNARLDTVCTSHLRNIVGFVPQEPVLFTNTVRENLCLGFEVTEQEMRDACQTAYAIEFILRLPLGFDTVIGAGGVRLSGGQKQRLAIARALIRNPSILVLDEATSALDTESEAVVQTALDAASRGRTTITIAHRLATIRNADNIFVFENGQVIENGTHDDLVDANGSYAELVRAQRLGDNDVEHRLKVIQRNEMKRRRSTIPEIVFVKPKEPPMEKAFSVIKFIAYSEKYIWILIVGLITGLIEGFLLIPLYIAMTDILLASNLADHNLALVKGRNIFLITLTYHFALFVTTSISGCLLMKYGLDIATKLRKAAYKKILSQDGYFFDLSENSVGNLLRILSEEAQNFDNAYDGSLNILLCYVGGYIGSNILLAFQAPGFALSTMALVLFSGFICVVLYFIVQYQTRKTQSVKEQAANIASEAIHNVKTIQLTNSEDHVLNLYTDTLSSNEGSYLKTTIINGILAGIGLTFLTYACAVIAVLGVIFIAARKVSTSVVLTAVATNVRFVFQLAMYLPDLSRSNKAFMDLYRLATGEPTVDGSDALRGDRPSRVKGNIILESVTFAYPNRPELRVLRDLKLKLPRGKTVAIVGASGCGKSTIVQLLSRMYDPLDGRILIDGIPYPAMNTQRLRSAFAFVGQDPALFDLPIWQNIAYGHPSATLEDIENAARAANIHEFIRDLPEGYETNLGSRGTQLSGGQRQRLAIARALVRNPAVIVFDEATSALDARSEVAFQAALANATRGKTCLIIAHRLSTIRDADIIAVLHHGKILETGTHQELIDKDGVYRRLVVGQ
uniref:ABC-type xenobiotic transporter n=1 Tax=Panagrellus redivivus TaxID=6233 RepID=A0A7E4W926_PANRE